MKHGFSYCEQPMNRHSVVNIAIYTIFCITSIFQTSCNKGTNGSVENSTPSPTEIRVAEFPEMIPIHAGTFMMGSPVSEKQRDHDETQHSVSVSAFFIGKYLVTQAEWNAIMGLNPSYFRGNNRLPVEGVTWYESIEYCNLISLALDLTPCYHYEALGSDVRRWPKDWKQQTHNHILCDWSANGYRLPTEAEWEYACRAGTTKATAFGDALNSEQANFNGGFPYNDTRKGPNIQRTSIVGSYKPNGWGVSDMHGNISEWCWDWYAAYPSEKQQDPHGPETQQSQRVYRGGSWFNYGAELRSANRFCDTPYFRLDMLPGGLRLARKTE